MSYQWTAIYTCELCGKTEPAGIPFCLRWLPEGWSGSRRKYGSCYCDECTTAIRNIREHGNETKDEVSE